MGIQNLMVLLKKYCIESIKYRKIEYYKNSTIGIDTNLLIYKMIYAIRLNGYDIKNENIIITHIHTFLQKIIGFIKYNIKAVFVFDGEMPELKYNTLKKRDMFSDNLQKKYYNATSDIDKKKYYYMKSKITDREIDDIISIINIFGFPIIFSPYEADSQLVYLQKNGLIDYIASDDMDMLVFGSTILLKNFTISDKKYICEINLNNVLNDLQISYKQFVDIAILMGTDYNDRLYGPIKSYYKIKKYGNLNNIVNGYDNISKYFINPQVNKIKKIKFNLPKIKTIKTNLTNFLNKFNYNNDKINNILNKIIQKV